MHDVEAIERATLAAVPPAAQRECDGWLLALDPGTVGRAHSATPLCHAVPAADTVARVEAVYAGAGLPAIFRLPDLPAFDAMKAQMAERGYRGTRPTLVQVARLPDVPVLAGAVEIAAVAQADWEQVFLGEGFDPVDGACRLDLLRRGRAARFASVRGPDGLVAVGAGCFSQGWCGLHGMRTVPPARRRGLAACIVSALARSAGEWGLAHAFLQVEEANAPARSVYGRMGFATAWRYAYWRRP